jgi:hypothetical protein
MYVSKPAIFMAFLYETKSRKLPCYKVIQNFFFYLKPSYCFPTNLFSHKKGNVGVRTLENSITDENRESLKKRFLQFNSTCYKFPGKYSLLAVMEAISFLSK